MWRAFEPSEAVAEGTRTAPARTAAAGLAAIVAGDEGSLEAFACCTYHSSLGNGSGRQLVAEGPLVA